MNCNYRSDADGRVLHKKWLRAQVTFGAAPVFLLPLLNTSRKARLACIPCILDFQMRSRVDSLLFLRRPNARGKPRRSAKRGGDPQAQLVGVGLTAQLGCGAKERATSS